MKKIFLMIAVVVLGLATANAQEKSAAGFEGKWWALGTFKYTDNDTESNLTVLPVLGTFVTTDITLGLGLGYTRTKVDGQEASDAFVVAPVARKYWGLNDKFFIFGQADVPVSFGDGYKTYGLNIRPGVDYFVSSHFSIEATFGQIGYNVFDPKDGDSTNEFTFGLNSGGAGLLGGLQFGLKYIF